MNYESFEEYIAFYNYNVKMGNLPNLSVREMLMKEAWHARDAEIEELRIKERVAKNMLNQFQAENEKLKGIIERGDEIKNNWENNCYQEAAHYNWLDDEIQSLKTQLQERDDLLSKVFSIYENDTKYISLESSRRTMIEHKQTLDQIRNEHISPKNLENGRMGAKQGEG